MTAAALELTERDSGGVRRLTPGSKVVVSLDENATTGHRWEVEKNGAPALRPAGDDVSAPGVAPGAGARRSFVFQAVAPGRGEIRIVLRRAWEDGVPPHRIFTASFEVAG